MMHIRVNYGSRSCVQVLYDIWDVDPADIVIPRNCVSEDTGKYLLFTDGSRMLTRILGKTHRFIITEVGMFYTNDYITQCIPKVKGTMYSGLFFCDESIHLHPPSKSEIKTFKEYFSGIKPKKAISKRVEMLIISKIREELSNSGIDEAWIVERRKGEATNAKNRGADRIQALTILARAGGIEIGAVQQQRLPLLPFFTPPGIGQSPDNKRIEAKPMEIIDVISSTKEQSKEQQ